MKKTALTIIGLLLGFCCSAQHISDEITLGNGDKVDFSYIFKPNDSCSFHSDINFDWRFCIYHDDPKKKDFIIAETNDADSFHFDISDILQFRSETVFFKEFDKNDIRYTSGYIEIIDNNQTIERKDIRLQIKPTKPQLVDFKFDYEYDWAYNDLGIDGGTLELTLEVDDDVNTVDVAVPDYYGHLFILSDDIHFRYFHRLNLTKVTSGKGFFSLDKLDWGIFMEIYSINSYGGGPSIIVNTTDFITDPKVLERINSLNPNASINSEPLNEPGIIYNRDELTINGDLTGDFKIEIYDIVGHKLLDNQNERLIDISGLPSGVFVVLLKTNNQIIKTLKISR